MAAPVLSYSSLRGALIAQLIEGDVNFNGRATYVGASEVGGCPRLVAFRKALGRPWVPDVDAAGVMLPGRLAEDHGVALLRRLGLDGTRLEATGLEQAELADGSLRGHPDGMFLVDAFELDPGSVYFRANGSAWDHAELRALITGPGILEFKSGSSPVFRDAVRSGLSPQYQDQIQSNMGLSGRGWSMLVFICRDNFAKLAIFFVPFSDPLYRMAHKKADLILGCAALARQALVDAGLPEADWIPEDSGVQGLVASCLPEEDPERGYCQKCPLWQTCPAMVKVVSDKMFPEAVQDEVDALAAIMKENAAIEKEAVSERESARDRIIELAEQYGATSCPLTGRLKELKIRYNKGRESASVSRLREMFPEVAAAVVTRGEDFPVCTITERK